jgi:uncharacterized protein YraI
MKRTLIFFLLAFSSLMLTACAPNAAVESQPVAMIVEPAMNASFANGEQVNVVTTLVHPQGASQAALFANGELVRSDDLTGPIHQGSMLQGWVPPGPGAYELQVLFTSLLGGELASNTIVITVGEEYLTENITEPELHTGEEPEVLQTATPTLPAAPTAIANQDTNCRVGPSTQYQNIGTFFLAQSAPIIGRLADSSWWVIDLADSSSDCWVWSQLVTTNGDTSGVPVVAPPPLPEVAIALVAPEQVSPQSEITCSSLVDATFSWEPVAGDVAAYEYQIQTGNSSGGSFSGFAGDETSDTEATVELVCGASNYYRWRVRAIGTDGEAGGWSGWIVLKVGF